MGWNCDHLAPESEFSAKASTKQTWKRLEASNITNQSIDPNAFSDFTENSLWCRVPVERWIEVKAQKNRLFTAKALCVIPSSLSQCKALLQLTFTRQKIQKWGGEIQAEHSFKKMNLSAVNQQRWRKTQRACVLSETLHLFNFLLNENSNSLLAGLQVHTKLEDKYGFVKKWP